VVPVSVGEVFSTPSSSAPQEARAIYFRSFLNPHDVHRMRAVIRMYLGLSTILCTTRPQVTGCDLQATIMGIAPCNRPVFNCRCRLSARQCDHRSRLRNLRPTALYAQIVSPGASSSGSGPSLLPVNPMTISAQSRLNSDGIGRLHGRGRCIWVGVNPPPVTGGQRHRN
jgi:hypothetical protein